MTRMPEFQQPSYLQTERAYQKLAHRTDKAHCSLVPSVGKTQDLLRHPLLDLNFSSLFRPFYSLATSKKDPWEMQGVEEDEGAARATKKYLAEKAKLKKLELRQRMVQRRKVNKIVRKLSMGQDKHYVNGIAVPGLSQSHREELEDEAIRQLAIIELDRLKRLEEGRSPPPKKVAKRKAFSPVNADHRYPLRNKTSQGDGAGSAPPDEAVEVVKKGSAPPEDAVKVVKKGSAPPEDAVKVVKKGSSPLKEAVKVAKKRSAPPTEAVKVAKRSAPPEEAVKLDKKRSAPPEEAVKVAKKGSSPPTEAVKVVKKGSSPSNEAVKVAKKRSAPPEEAVKAAKKRSAPPEEAVKAAKKRSAPPEEVVKVAKKRSSPPEEAVVKKGSPSKEAATVKVPKDSRNKVKPNRSASEIVKSTRIANRPSR